MIREEVSQTMEVAMKRSVIWAVALTGVTASSAFAADLGGVYETPIAPAPAPVFSWTGFYLGGHVGYGWSNKDWTLVQNAGNEISNRVGSQITSHEAVGVLGGVQLGYNHQLNRIVLGVEGEFSWTGMDGGSSWLNEGDVYRDATTDINWIATLAGRIGFAFDRKLLYVKGGIAWADEDFSHTGGSIRNDRYFTGGDTRFGWLIGVGLEYALDTNWSVKAEYDYLNFGSDNVSLTDGDRTAIFDIDQDFHIAKIGISYKFDTARQYEPLK